MATPEKHRPPGRSPDATLLVRAAEMAVLRSVVDPAQALDAGRTILHAAEAAGATEAEVVALRAMALAARELGDLPGAEEHLRQAIRTVGAPAERRAQARLSLVTVRTERGHPLQALRVAALAWAYLSPLDRAKLDTQRAVALAHLGRYQEAIASCDRALRALAAAPGTVDDRRFLAGGLLNRGLVHAYRGDWDDAMRDISACLEISRHAGLRHLTRLAAANLPFLAVRRGDISGAFTHYRAAEDTLFGYPERLATMRADFAAALLAAHLPGEARALLSLAVPDLDRTGAHTALAEARLKLAQVELLTGDPHEAMTVAERAMRELSAQDRRAWLPLAREVVLRARLALEPPTAALLAELIKCASELEDTANAAEAAALRLVAAETALAVDDHPAASAQLDRLTAHARRCEPRAPAGTRLTSLLADSHAGRLARAAQVPGPVRQHALALEAALQEDIAAAFRAVREGLAEVGDQADAFDDPALRAHAVRAGERLAAFGLRLAVRDGGAEEVFEWAERWRAVAAPAHACSPAGLGQVRAALGRAALVEFVPDGESLVAVVITDERVVLRRLGALLPVTEALIRLRYSLRRVTLRDGLLTGHPPTEPLESPAGGVAGHPTDGITGDPTDGGAGEPTGGSAGEPGGGGAGEPAGGGTGEPGGGGADEPLSVRHTAEPAAALERLLLGPIGDEIGDRPLVLVPTGALHTLPWATLPSLRERPVSVAASAAAWLGATRRAPVTEPSTVIAAVGPGLAHAREEVDRVLACHPRGREVPARTGPVLAALQSADVLHLAAHGVFHARSPLLSSITLDDGPLMAYDLLGMAQAARLVVLSSCDSGMARTPTDGAPLGLAGTFLTRGAACVVAGLVPVRDEDALALMIRFHELLAAGHAPATALAYASAKTGVLGFVCFGAGDQPVATGLEESATQLDQEPT
ncbi:CHAT domain-containing protein [Nonomuraea glycinis]|uniref:CHAT domain-containing protein n=1 Tax=Nonomuraea glycinis TaxID=2047744 RepID=UPI0033AEB6D7